MRALVRSFVHAGARSLVRALARVGARSFVCWAVDLYGNNQTKPLFCSRYRFSFLIISETFFSVVHFRYQWNIFQCRSFSFRSLNMLRNKPPPKWLWIGNSNTRPFVTSFDNEFRKFSLCTKIDQYKTVSRKMRGYFSASQNQIRRGDIFLDVEICQS